MGAIFSSQTYFVYLLIETIFSHENDAKYFERKVVSTEIMNLYMGGDKFD